MKETNRFLKAALFYSQRLHWPVLPIKPRQKKPPLTPNGSLDATTDETQIRAWWKKWPNANVALRTGVKFWALDVDPQHGGEESFRRLVYKYGALADTLTQTTGGGGSQRLYEQPAEAITGRAPLYEDWPGIDARGQNNYILVAPSIHPSGKEYVWDTAKPSILNEPICPANAWLIQWVRQAHSGTNGAGGKRDFEAIKEPKKFPKGRQQQILVSIAGKLRDMGFEPEEYEPLMQAVNKRRCTEPGPEKNIHQYAYSVKYPPKHSVEELAKEEPQNGRKAEKKLVLPEALSVDQILDLEVAPPETLIENLLPRRGLAMITGAQRSGKTVFAAQAAIALATNRALFDYYQLRAHGPAIFMEKDDPGGNASFKEMYMRAKVPRGTPIHHYPHDRIPIPLGHGFLEWLDIIVPKYGAVLVVLDSYTALRPARKSGGDLVLDERREIGELDELAKRLGCLILLIHHESITTRSNSSLDWDARGAGTYGMTMATECQIAISRYRDLAIDAPERLLRFRSRHLKEHQLTLCYQQASGLFDHVVDGRAAPLYHLIHEIKRHVQGEQFMAKDLEEPLGISRPTAFRHLALLVSAGAVWRAPPGGGYRLAPDIERLKIPGM
jgi:hypothetical protein